MKKIGKIRKLTSDDEVLRLKRLEELKKTQAVINKILNKNLLFVLVTLMISVSFSCRSTKKGCNGNGSWYGNRNLSLHSDTIDSINNINTYAICKQH